MWTVKKKRKKKKVVMRHRPLKQKQLLTLVYAYDENDSLVYIYLWNLCNYMLTYGLCHSCYGNTLIVI